MPHAVVRTNETGQPFLGKCLKCGEECLTISESKGYCPKDDPSDRCKESIPEDQLYDFILVMQALDKIPSYMKEKSDE